MMSKGKLDIKTLYYTVFQYRIRIMPNRFSDILFQLIHSLEKAEKRHFKLYIKRSSSKEDLKIVQLFDAMAGGAYKGKAGSSSSEIAGPSQPLRRYSSGHRLTPLKFPRFGRTPIAGQSMELQT